LGHRISSLSEEFLMKEEIVDVVKYHIESIEIEEDILLKK
jgi:hypothetical protein